MTKIKGLNYLYINPFLGNRGSTKHNCNFKIIIVIIIIKIKTQHVEISRIWLNIHQEKYPRLIHLLQLIINFIY